jgi:excisionase family DNA binding protein
VRISLCHTLSLSTRRQPVKRFVQICAKIGIDETASLRLSDRMTQKTLTLQDVATYTGIKRRTLYNMLKDGRFPVQSIPGTKPKRWSFEDVQAWIAGTYPA